MLQCLVCNGFDKKATDDSFGQRREKRHSEGKIVDNFHMYPGRQPAESPDDVHTFRPGLKVFEMDFAMLAIDDLFGHPGNWNKAAVSCHFDQVPDWISLVIMNVAIMRQKRWPAFEVGCGLENCLFRGIHDDRICLVRHGRFAR